MTKLADMDDKFTVWMKRGEDDAPYQHGTLEFAEPAEAADFAERCLQLFRPPAYAEIRFNGDVEPHTVIFLMPESTRLEPVYGVWNTDSALWPLYYPDTPSASMLDGPLPAYNDPTADTEISDDGETDVGEDADSMDLGAEDDGEDDPEDEMEDDDESPEDENAEEESEDSSDDSDEDEGSDEGESDEEDEVDDEDETEADSDDDFEDENKTEQEAEVIRLPIFGKMRGPKGWRKRADAEELLTRNVFALKVGVLDPDADKPGQQERNVVAHVEFIESDESRKAGLLRLTLPEGVSLDDFRQAKNGKITVEVPYGN